MDLPRVKRYFTFVWLYRTIDVITSLWKYWKAFFLLLRFTSYLFLSLFYLFFRHTQLNLWLIKNAVLSSVHEFSVGFFFLFIYSDDGRNLCGQPKMIRNYIRTSKMENFNSISNEKRLMIYKKNRIKGA